MRFRRNKKGFTLVELIVVIAILAILAAVATVSITGIVNNASKNAIRSDLAKYKAGYDAFISDPDTTTVSLVEFKKFVHSQTGTYKISGSETLATSAWGTWANDNTKTVSITVRSFTGTINVTTGVITGI